MTLGESNEALFVRYRSDGDPEAFRLIFERTAAVVARGARRLGVPEHEVDDVVQETFVAALAGARRFDPSRDLVDWLWGIMCKKAVDVSRRKARQQVRPERLRPRSTERPSDRLEAEEIRDVLERSLRKLPQPYGEVLRLHYEQRLTAESIGRQLGRSPNTVRTQIARGIVRLRRVLPAGLTPAILGVLGLPALLRGTPPGDSVPVHPAPAVARAPRAPLAWAAAAALLAVPVVLVVATRSPGPAVAVVSAAATPATTAAAAELEAAAVPEAEVASAPASARSDTGTDARAIGPVRIQLMHLDNGMPVPEVTLAIVPHPGRFAGTVRETFDTPCMATTDEHGIAHFIDAPLGAVRLRFSNGGISPPYDVTSDRTLVVAVDRVVIIEGTVCDPDGAPLPNAQVWTRRPATEGAGNFYPGVAITRSRADGSFRVVLVDVEGTTLWACVPRSGRSDMVDFELTEPLVQDVRLVVHPATGGLRGWVRHPGGDGAADGLVMAYPAHLDPRPLPVVNARTGRAGGFSMHTLVPGPYQVVAMGADGTFAIKELDIGPQPTAPVTLWLSRGASVAGRITGAGGEPQPGLLVVTAPPADTYRFGTLLTRMTRTAADGTFALPIVPPGPTTLAAVHPHGYEVLALTQRDLVRDHALDWSPRLGAAPHETRPDLAAWIRAVVRSVEPAPSDAPVLGPPALGR